MDFEFDPVKSERNLRERGFDFDFASRIFESRTVEQVDGRRSYGETRIKAIRRIGGRVYAVIYTDRNGARRIISARHATRKERQIWLTSE